MLTRRARRMAPDAGGGGQPPAAPPAGGTPPSADPPAGDPPAAPPAPAELKLTEAQLKERLDRARRSRETELRKALGLADNDDLGKVAESLKKQREAEEAAKSEQQKLSERAARAEQERAELAAKVQRHEDLAFLRRHARGAGLVDDEDAHELVLGRMRAFWADKGLKVGERPTAEQMSEFLAGVKKGKPYLFGAAPGDQKGTTTGGDGGVPGGGRGGGAGQPQVDFSKLTREQQLEEARKRGWA